MKTEQYDNIIERYITSDDSIIDIVDLNPSKYPKPAKALRKIRACLQGKILAKDAIKAAEEISANECSSELLLLILGSWLELSIRLGRLSEADAIVHRIKALLTEKTHPAIIAYTQWAEAMLIDAKGNKIECEKLLRKITNILPEHSPRHKFYIWELAMFLAQQGRLKEYKKGMKTLAWQCNNNFPPAKITFINFINAMETGNIQDASGLLPEITGNSALKPEYSRIPIHGYQALLKLMNNSSAGKPPLSHDIAQNKHVYWPDIIKALLLKENDTALSLARSNAKTNLKHIVGQTFDSFCMIRAELASGNAEAARHLIDIRNNRGNKHYFDDFFLARAELLANNRKLAATHFADLLQAVEKYNAHGRLDFEMVIANELSHGNIIALTRHASQIINSKKLPLSSSRSYTGKTTTTKPEPDDPLKNIIGSSDTIKNIRETIRRFADLDAPVLITGETGTGKEVIARAIHEMSARKKQPFIPVNCSSLTETLLESELFGYERGAFTGANRTTKGLFESAGKGTIFLDEIGDISPRLQVSLLRVLETGEIRGVGSSNTRKITCRIIAATNADLEKLSATGQFRKDLIFRLQRLLINLPPLRERPEDILQLVRFFIDTGRKVGAHAALSEDLKKALQKYNWPGNVRELKNIIERMRLMHSDKLFYNINDLDIKFRTPAEEPTQPVTSPPPTPISPQTTNTTYTPTPSHEPERQPATPPASQPDFANTPATDDEQIDAIINNSRSPLRRQEKLRELFNKYKKLTRSEIITITGVSPNTATKDLKLLCKENFIKRIEPSASTRSHYFVKIEELEEK